MADEQPIVPAEAPPDTAAVPTAVAAAPAYTQLTQVRVPLDEAADALALPDQLGRVPIVILPTRPNRVRVEALAAAAVIVLVTFLWEFSFAFESLLFVVAIALVVVAVFRSFIVPVPAGAQALMLRRGKYDRTLDAGTHIAPPWIAVSHLVTTREIPFDAPSIEVPSSDGVRVSIDVLATFAITQPERFVFAIAASDFDQVCLATCVTATRDAVRGAKVDEVLGFSEPDAERLSAALGEMLETYGVEIKRAAFTSIRPPNEYMASLEGRRLAAIQQPEQDARHALNLRRQADRDDLARQAAGARKALIEEEAAVEELRLRRLHERIQAYPDAARWDVESARLEIARSLAGNTRAMVQLGPGTDVANAILGRELADDSPPRAAACPARVLTDRGARPAQPSASEQVARPRQDPISRPQQRAPLWSAGRGDPDVRLDERRRDPIRDGGVVEEEPQLGVAVHRPRVEVERADQGAIVADDHLGVHQRRVFPDLGARRQELVVVMPERGMGDPAVGLVGHDHADGDATTRRLDDVADHARVTDVRVGELQASRGGADQVACRIGQREPAARPVHDHRDRVRALGAGVARIHLQRRIIRRHRAAVVAEAREEHRLQLARDRSGHADVHVVEAAVREVVLDARAPDPGDLAVDQDQLAMLDPPELVERPGEAPVGEGSGAVGRQRIVEHHLDPGVGQARQHLARAEPGMAPERVEDEPHADAIASLRGHDRRELVTDDARVEAVLHDVDGVTCALDVRQHARVEVPSLGHHLHLGRRARLPRAGQLRVRDTGCGDDPPRVVGGTLGRDGVSPGFRRDPRTDSQHEPPRARHQRGDGRGDPAKCPHPFILL